MAQNGHLTPGDDHTNPAIHKGPMTWLNSACGAYERQGSATVDQNFVSY